MPEVSIEALKKEEKMKAVLCPVCDGRGGFLTPEIKGIASPANNFSQPPIITVSSCHGCDGKGWVEVREA